MKLWLIYALNFLLRFRLYKRLIQWIANHPFLMTLGLVFLLISLGTTGYLYIEEDWTFLDSLYMTIITITTIGYGEVNTLSPQGRIFTMGLVVVGVIIASYAITATIELFTTESFIERIRKHRRLRTLETIHDHCIICGYGRLGRSLGKEMQRRNAPIIIIDIDTAVAQKCKKVNIPVIQGNATDEKNLQDAGIERAKSLVAAARSDAENVFIVLTAKSMNPDLHIVSRCNIESSIPKIEKAGADMVISPYHIAGQRIAQMLTRPKISSFLDGILEFGDHKMRLEEFVIHPSSPLAGKSLQEAKLKVAVLAVGHPNESVLSHAHAFTMLHPHTAMIVMGTNKELEKLSRLTRGKS